jgi:hypothetical protein
MDGKVLKIADQEPDGKHLCRDDIASLGTACLPFSNQQALLLHIPFPLIWRSATTLQRCTKHVESSQIQSRQREKNDFFSFQERNLAETGEIRIRDWIGFYHAIRNVLMVAPAIAAIRRTIVGSA